MIVGIDFDRVLFRTDEFKSFLDDEIPGFLESYPSEGNYNPEKHAEEIGVDVDEIFQALEHASDFLYDDIEKLENLRDDHKVLIVSRGDPYFQERKIADSGVLEHVDGYFIVEEEAKDEVNIDVLIDDREKELEEVSVPGLLLDRDEKDMSDLISFVVEEASR